MTKKRLNKSGRNSGKRKKASKTVRSHSINEKTQRAANSSQKLNSKADNSLVPNIFPEGNYGPATSMLPLCSTKSSNKFKKSHIRFRPVNATVGREFNSHDDIWQPAMMDVCLDDNISPCGLTGLTNLGNTCYMNAAVQALSNCPPFSDFFRSLNSTAPFASKRMDGDGEPPVSRSLRRLLQALWSEERNSYVNPQTFLAEIRHHYPQFRMWTQQDAQEFIRCLLDLLHRELRQPVFAWEYRNATRNGSRQMKSANSSDFPPASNFASRSSSLSSDDEERYETADSGWSSDADMPGAKKERDHLELRNRDCLVQNQSCYINQGNPLKDDECTRQKKTPIYYRSLVTEVFDGQLRSTVKCLTCHHLSETCETFQDLSLGIPTREQIDSISSHSTDVNAEKESGKGEQAYLDGTDNGLWQWPWWFGRSLFRSLYRYLFGDVISLNEALTAFFSPDDLRGENMYSCEKCAKLRNGVKICKILTLPEVLCIHLKRFRHELSYSTKVRTTVTFPIHDLDLTPFVASSETNGEPILYDLIAFITHCGRSPENGHYVAYCKNEVDENWYEYDDTEVTRLETADILTKEAYVFFYQRQSPRDMDIIRNRVRQMLEEDARGDVEMKVPLHHYISREWLHRLSTFAQPGPITNHDFLCQHSQVLPRRSTHLIDYYATISSSLWDFLHEKFGGGPASSELHYCLVCQNEYQMMKHKRETELKAYVALEGQLKKLKKEIPVLTYSYYLPPNVIAKAWIDKWKGFVDGDEFEPPGSIDNDSLLICGNGSDSKYHLRTSQYMQLPREIWLFFQSLYGGGPELLCIPNDHPSEQKLQQLVTKVNEKIAEAFDCLKTDKLADIIAWPYPSFDNLRSTLDSNVSSLTFSDLTTDITCSKE